MTFAHSSDDVALHEIRFTKERLRKLKTTEKFLAGSICISFLSSRKSRQQSP